MKISYNWLREYIDTDKSPEEVAALLTNCGLEVESSEVFQSVKGGLKGVVVGMVLTKAKHPDADKLSVTTVNVGNNEVLNIVCGAPNVEAGQKVLVATIGTTLHNGEESFEIKKSKIRGVVSEGMICAEDELGLGESHAGIMVLDPNAKVGMTAKDYLHLTDDIVFEIGLTPNRPDATSHIGVARDLFAVINARSWKLEAGSWKTKLNIPSVEKFKIDNHEKQIEVKVEDSEACPRYSGLTISGFAIKDSPDWLKNRLKAVGLRPINNIVDITNYVMMETGQPLHAFDSDKIKGNKVIVKKLSKGTRFITLDEVERKLTENDLMICNADEGMCIAGVFGGLNSGIRDTTTSLFLESANFNPGSIRKSSKFHGLSTDSSFRFERGADPNITVYALKRAAILIKDIAGGNISSDIIDVYLKPIENTIINVSLNNVYKLIGKTIDKSIIVTILENLGIKILKESVNQVNTQYPIPDTRFVLSVPPYKSDVKREVDIIEEILRIYGYNNVEIPDSVRLSLNSPQSTVNSRQKEKLQNTISDYLSNNSFFEVYCNSLTRSTYSETVKSFNPSINVNVLHPISKELNVMRQTLLFGGLETIEHNYNRKLHDLKLYEFGNTYSVISHQSSVISRKGKANNLENYKEESHLALFMIGRKYNETWKTADNKVDFFDIKFHINNILSFSGIDISKLSVEKFNDDIFETGLIYKYETEKEIVRFGELNRAILKLFDIKTEIYFAEINWDKLIKLSEGNIIKYKDLPKYPEVRRDIAMLIDKNIQYADIEKTAYQAVETLHATSLLKKVDLFDVYEGDKIDKLKKSYAISLILQDNEKTLTDFEVDKVVDKIRTAITDKFNAVIR
jgi:phenylalanyl-tRNA synthetase beta chain